MRRSVVGSLVAALVVAGVLVSCSESSPGASEEDETSESEASEQDETRVQAPRMIATMRRFLETAERQGAEAAYRDVHPVLLDVIDEYPVFEGSIDQAIEHMSTFSLPENPQLGIEGDTGFIRLVDPRRDETAAVEMVRIDDRWYVDLAQAGPVDADGMRAHIEAQLAGTAPEPR